MGKVNLVGMLCDSPNSIADMVNLDPTDPRTRCYKRAVATHIAVEEARHGLADLGKLTGLETIDWDTPYCDQLDVHQEDRVAQVVESSLASAGQDPIYAVTHAVRHFVLKDVPAMSTDKSNEYIRQVVNGIVNPTRS